MSYQYWNVLVIMSINLSTYLLELVVELFSARDNAVEQDINNGDITMTSLEAILIL